MPRPDVSYIRRPQILEAAREIFGKTGIDAATMDDIADACGLSKATIYRYFENKEALVLAVLDDVFEPDPDIIAALKDPEIPVDDRSELYMFNILGRLADDQARSALIFDFYGHAHRVPEFRSRLREFNQQYLDAFETLYQHGVDEGLFRPFDPREAAEFMLGWVQSMALLEFTQNRAEGEHLNGVIDRFFEVFKQQVESERDKELGLA